MIVNLMGFSPSFFFGPFLIFLEAALMEFFPWPLRYHVPCGDCSEMFLLYSFFPGLARWMVSVCSWVCGPGILVETKRWTCDTMMMSMLHTILFETQFI